MERRMPGVSFRNHIANRRDHERKQDTLLALLTTVNVTRHGVVFTGKKTTITPTTKEIARVRGEDGWSLVATGDKRVRTV